MEIWNILIIGIPLIILAVGIRIVRPTHRMAIETLGKYSRTAEQGFNWIFPVIQQTRYVNIKLHSKSILSSGTSGGELFITNREKIGIVINIAIYSPVLNIIFSKNI